MAGQSTPPSDARQTVNVTFSVPVEGAVDLGRHAFSVRCGAKVKSCLDSKDSQKYDRGVGGSSVDMATGCGETNCS